jgi:hypothetical protein
MENWKRALAPDGLNWWTVVSGIGMNFVLTSFLFLTMMAFAPGPEPPSGAVLPAAFTLILSAGAFLIPLLTAYICGRLADERYLAYAFYPLIGFLILAVPGVLYAGMFGVLIVLFGALGAFNGATLVARRAAKRRHVIDNED